MADSNDYSFDVFISYATNPDYSLARKLESFLETFNNLPTPENLSLTPLRICVDGSDFHTGTGSGAGSEVKSTIESYLAKSKELLVLCSRNARKSTWVDQEIRWFLANRGPNSIRVALTEGEDLSKLDEVFPQAILETGLSSESPMIFEESINALGRNGKQSAITTMRRRGSRQTCMVGRQARFVLYGSASNGGRRATVPAFSSLSRSSCSPCWWGQYTSTLPPRRNESELWPRANERAGSSMWRA